MHIASAFDELTGSFDGEFSAGVPLDLLDRIIEIFGIPRHRQ
jgi:hypothetical protein